MQHTVYKLVAGAVGLVLLSCSVLAEEWRNCGRLQCPLFTGNVTVNDSDYYSFRFVHVNEFTEGGVGAVGILSSYSSSSYSSSSSSHTNTVDVLDARITVATSLPPTATMSWYENVNDYQLSLNSSDITSNDQAGPFSTAMSVVFLDVIEFYDTDGNEYFDPDVDTRIQSISLADQVWDVLCAQRCANETVILNISTFSNPFPPTDTRFSHTDSQHPSVNAFPHDLTDSFSFSLECTQSQIVGKTADGLLYSPRGMKISLRLTNFPYIGFNNSSNTRLCLSAIVGSSHANLSNMTLTHDPVNHLIQSGAGGNAVRLSWSEQVEIDGDKGRIVKSSSFNAPSSDQLQRIGKARQIVFKGNPSSQVDFKVVYFNFVGQQPNDIYWDPEIESGIPLLLSVVESRDFQVIIISCSVAVAIVGAVSAVIVASRLERKKKHEEQQLTVDSSSSSSSSSSFHSSYLTENLLLGSVGATMTTSSSPKQGRTNKKRTPGEKQPLVSNSTYSKPSDF